MSIHLEPVLSADQFAGLDNELKEFYIPDEELYELSEGVRTKLYLLNTSPVLRAHPNKALEWWSTTDAKGNTSWTTSPKYALNGQVRAPNYKGLYPPQLALPYRVDAGGGVVYDKPEGSLPQGRKAAHGGAIYD